MTAAGPFDVKLVPQEDPLSGGESGLGRMTLDKQFHGDLEATSRGQMLTGMTATKGSAGYVAIERVAGTLKGLRGSFTLMHYGRMNRGAQSLEISVVPDSGTEALTGLSGSMAIIIEGGQHSYQFTYSLDQAS